MALRVSPRSVHSAGVAEKPSDAQLRTVRAFRALPLGPSLVPAGVTGALVDPQLYIFQGGTLVTSNDDWGGIQALQDAFATVGAGALGSDTSKAAALLVTLQPGVYSAQVSGVGGTTGVGLVEVFLMP